MAEEKCPLETCDKPWDEHEDMEKITHTGEAFGQDKTSPKPNSGVWPS